MGAVSTATAGLPRRDPNPSLEPDVFSYICQLKKPIPAIAITIVKNFFILRYRPALLRIKLEGASDCISVDYIAFAEQCQ
jgi:hypothetical protein